MTPQPLQNPLRAGYILADVEPNAKACAEHLARRLDRAAEHLAGIAFELAGLGLPVTVAPLEHAATACAAYGVALSNVGPA
ncbi:MAG TPA: hypothetical protein P5024_12210 [Burkholderiaceae bacterium]|nr:hypothetical protein [Burkholderiaceae bacterium]HRZ02313.1 hypothetical protein [Burkholderiaceae bacterium]